MEVFEHHPNLFYISSSAAEGCHLCSILLAFLFEYASDTNSCKVLLEGTMPLDEFLHIEPVHIEIIKRENWYEQDPTVDMDWANLNLHPQRLKIDVEDECRIFFKIGNTLSKASKPSMHLLYK